MLKSTVLVLFGATMMTLMLSNAAHALTFNWNYSGIGTTAAGTLEANPTANPTEYLIQSITGQRNSVNIDALLPLGSYFSDNFLYFPGPGPQGGQLRVGGFSYSAGGQAFNVWYSSGQGLAVGGGFLPAGQYETQFNFISGGPGTGIKDSSIQFSATPVPTPVLLPGLLGIAAAANRKRKVKAMAT
jgi:hypothetical protein